MASKFRMYTHICRDTSVVPAHVLGRALAGAGNTTGTKACGACAPRQWRRHRRAAVDAVAASPPSPSGGSAAQRATADLTRQCSCAHETRTEDMDNLMCTRIPSSNCTRCMTCYSCSGACRVVAGPVGVRLSGEHCAGFQWTDAMDSRDPVGCSGCGSAATRS